MVVAGTVEGMEGGTLRFGEGRGVVGGRPLGGRLLTGGGGGG